MKEFEQRSKQAESAAETSETGLGGPCRLRKVNQRNGLRLSEIGAYPQCNIRRKIFMHQRQKSTPIIKKEGLGPEYNHPGNSSRARESGGVSPKGINFNFERQNAP